LKRIEHVPLFDMGKRIHKYRSTINEAISGVLDSSNLILGDQLRGFEINFAEYLDSAYAVGVANGTDAIEISLRAIGVTAGDYVAISAHCGDYALVALNAIGAHPMFLDLDLALWEVDLNEIFKIREKNVKALIITHMFGNPISTIGQIVKYCFENGIELIEDCAQAHGAEINGKKVGNFGIISTFSFYPTKNLGAIGDAGLIATSDKKIYEKLKKLRNYGWGEKYRIEIENGRNSRMDEIQAAILIRLLPELANENNRRREIANQYFESIKNAKILLPPFKIENSVFHLFPIRCATRNLFMEFLKINGISTAIHYPILSLPKHNLKHSLMPKLNGSQKFVNEILSIPCFPEMTDLQVEYVIDVINQF